MNIKTNLMTGVAAFALTLVAGAAHAVPDLSIDEFTGPGNGPVVMEISIEDGTPVASVSAFDNRGSDSDANAGVSDSPAIIGGYRDVTTTLTAIGSGLGDTTARVVVGANGVFTHNQDSGVVSSTTIVWDGLAGDGQGNNGTAGDGLGGLDLSAYDLVEIGVERADAGITWQFSLFDGAETSSDTVDTTDGIVPPGIPVFIDFAALCAGLTNGCTSIDAISFVANFGDGASDFDTTVDYIRLVDTPEPATLSILGAGLIGLGAVARRRRKS
ncbi:MAG: PEP-CTERM sorting domain-containing protein [Alphaproteobacteria bacterium]